MEDVNESLLWQELTAAQDAEGRVRESRWSASPVKRRWRGQAEMPRSEPPTSARPRRFPGGPGLSSLVAAGDAVSAGGPAGGEASTGGLNRKLFLQELEQAVGEFAVTERLVQSQDEEFQRALATLNKRATDPRRRLSQQSNGGDKSAIAGAGSEGWEALRQQMTEMAIETRVALQEVRGAVQSMAEAARCLQNAATPSHPESSGVLAAAMPERLAETDSSANKGAHRRRRVWQRTKRGSWRLLFCLVLVAVGVLFAVPVCYAMLWFLLEDFVYAMV